MRRDPFYREIFDRLSGELDPEEFERCAVDVLRPLYPRLVPIRGGSDEGMDGAIADLEGPAFPLVTTTDQNPARNLRRSLASYQKSENLRRQAVFATSQLLTQRRRKALEKVAEKLGFTLVQTHDRADFADRLYHSPKWCKEVLELTGQPPALSARPRTYRPAGSSAVIGRDEALRWLRETPGDLLLVGQPGAGKTCLFESLAREDLGLFVISKNETEIANGIRSQQPPALLVDDSHADPDFLLRLRHLRETIGANVRILANCWPGGLTAVKAALDVPSASVLSLPLLTRDAMADVVRSAGIQHPNSWIQEIVNQSSGRPGLAVTLCHLCLRGEHMTVGFGTALANDTRLKFEPLFGRDVTPILAAFAIGGYSGMSIEAVSASMGVPIFQIHQMLVELSHGGVIFDNEERLFSVRPEALRDALVRDVFFGRVPLPVESLLDGAADFDDATEVLIGARARGANVPFGLIENRLPRSSTPRLWEQYASLCRSEVEWILKHHPDRLGAVSYPALRHAADLTIPRLLNAAIGDDRALHSNPSHPLRLIEDWIADAYPGSEAAMAWRVQLLDAALVWHRNGGDLGVTLKALKSAMSIGFHSTNLVPGSGDAFQVHFGSLLHDEITKLGQQWSRIADLLGSTAINDWSLALEIVEEWVYPGRVGPRATPEVADAIQSVAGQMVRSIAALAAGRPGVLDRCDEYAGDLELQIDLAIDADFRILFPRRRSQLSANWDEFTQAALGLAAEWSVLPPSEVSARIAYLQAERASAGAAYLDLTPFVCNRIADQVSGPLEWLLACLTSKCPTNCLDPFLRRAADLNVSGWSDALRLLLQAEPFQSSAIVVGLSHSSVSDELFEDVLAVLREPHFNLIEFHCTRGDVGEDRVRRLLQHANPAVSSAAALGEWHRDSEKRVRPGILDAWRAAMLRGVHDQHAYHVLEAAFSHCARLAYDWIESNLKTSSSSTGRIPPKSTVASAVAALNRQERAELLDKLPEATWWDDLVSSLVGDDMDLFRRLLNLKLRFRNRFAPLNRPLDQTWVRMAETAVNAGYSADDIIRAKSTESRFFSGSEAEMWAERIAEIDKAQTADSEVLLAMKSLRAIYDSRRQYAALREHEEAVFGREPR